MTDMTLFLNEIFNSATAKQLCYILYNSLFAFKL